MSRLRTRLRRLLVPAAPADAIVAAAPALTLRAIFSTFWPLTRPYRRVMAVSALVLCLLPALETAQIWLFKVVVDDVLVPRDLGALVPVAGVYLGLTLGAAVVSFADDYLAAWIGERFLLDLRARLFAHLQRLSLDALDRRRHGDLISRLTSDVQAIERFVLTAVGEALSAGVQLLFFAGALLLLSWKLALASFVVVPLFYLTARRFARLVKHASREERRRSGSLSAVAEEALASAALVQSLNREETEDARFRAESTAIMEAELATTRIEGLFAPLVDFIELAGALIVLALGVWALTSGELTLGELLVFLTYLSQLYRPVRSLSSLSNELFSASAAAERVIELLDERPRVEDRPGARRIARARGEIELRGVTYCHPGAAVAALRDVSLRVAPGEVVAVTGPSGAGKSTLARLLLRFDDPSGGAVLLDGTDLRDLRLRSVREQIGLLLQETVLLDGTIRDAIAYGRPGATSAQIEAAARAAGVHGFVTALPDGYATRVGPRGRSLSGGQGRRIAVARALVRDTPVLILDEPTTGLDAGARDAMLGPLRSLMHDRTTIIVSHDPVVVGCADRVVRLEAGRVAEAGGGAALREVAA
ncbi:MAG: ATP-binding cassette, subfamily bacterial [Solirubrobacteraceae bacterium]|nr:ATP-binding cassette, subfamily bacterial [Solirubrobacteraceae bacterium]